MVRESHEQGTSPGKTVLVELLTRAAPCVVLMDEMVAYLRQFEPGKSYKAGTFDSNRPIDHSPVITRVKKQFFASCELDPKQAKLQFSDIYDEIIEQFTTRGISVKLSFEIEANHETGFDEGLQRAIKENCGVLKFNNVDFEE